MLRFSESVLGQDLAVLEIGSGQDLAVLEVGSGLNHPTLKPLVSFNSRYKAPPTLKGKARQPTSGPRHI